MLIKVKYNGKSKIFKFDEKTLTYGKLIESITNNFHKLQSDEYLFYVDDEKELIQMSSDPDLEACLEEMKINGEDLDSHFKIVLFIYSNEQYNQIMPLDSTLKDSFFGNNSIIPQEFVKVDDSSEDSEQNDRKNQNDKDYISQTFQQLVYTLLFQVNEHNLSEFLPELDKLVSQSGNKGNLMKIIVQTRQQFDQVVKPDQIESEKNTSAVDLDNRMENFREINQQKSHKSSDKLNNSQVSQNLTLKNTVTDDESPLIYGEFCPMNLKPHEDEEKQRLNNGLGSLGQEANVLSTQTSMPVVQNEPKPEEDVSNQYMKDSYPQLQPQKGNMKNPYNPYNQHYGHRNEYEGGYQINRYNCNWKKDGYGYRDNYNDYRNKGNPYNQYITHKNPSYNQHNYDHHNQNKYQRDGGVNNNAKMGIFGQIGKIANRIFGVGGTSSNVMTKNDLNDKQRDLYEMIKSGYNTRQSSKKDKQKIINYIKNVFDEKTRSELGGKHYLQILTEAYFLNLQKEQSYFRPNDII